MQTELILFSLIYGNVISFQLLQPKGITAIAKKKQVLHPSTLALGDHYTLYDLVIYLLFRKYFSD
jgi:hypothetical protein